MRPDEKSALDRIQRDRNLESNIKTGLGTAATLGAGSAIAGLGSKIAPFLSEYIPVDLAVKGISRVSPKMGNFLKKGMEKGLNVKDGINFLKDKFSSPESLQEKPKDNRNIIQQYSDELHTFIDNAVKSGESPTKVGGTARQDPKFKKIIEKIEKDHQTPWPNIIDSIYRNSNQPEQPQSPQQAQPNGAVQQKGNTDQAIMAALEKILSM